MRTRRYEYLLPAELLAEMACFSVAYLPLGPLEWHGPHLPLGTDPLIAQEIGLEVAERIGGVVMPTLYIGSDARRDAKMLENLGFEDTAQDITGMDFPANSVRSLYYDRDVLATVVSHTLAALDAQGWRLIVVLNAHGGENHVQALREVCGEADRTLAAHVLLPRCVWTGEPDAGGGHASRLETSLIAHIAAESVDIGALPPMPEKLYPRALGIVDSDTFSGRPQSDFSLPKSADPRAYSARQGARVVRRSAEAIARQVLEAYGALDR